MTHWAGILDLNQLLTIYAADDGYFPTIPRKNKQKTVLTVIKTRVYRDKIIVFDDMKIDKIEVDSMEVTNKIRRMISDYKPKRSDVLLLDGITYAGFGVINISKLKEVIKNVIVFFYRPLDIEKIKNALIKNFHDWYERYNIILEVYRNSAVLEINSITMHVHSSFSLRETRKVLEKTTLFSPIPEPLRMAHIIASTLSKKTIYYKK